MVEDVTRNGKDGLRDPDAVQSDGATPECTIHPAHTKAEFWTVQDLDTGARIRSLDIAAVV